MKPVNFIEFFENNIIKKNDSDITYYILSDYFEYYSKNRTLLSKLSIFDDEKRGTIYNDKMIVNKILDILMNKKFSKEQKTYELDKLKISKKERKGIGSMLGMAIGDAMGARLEFLPIKYDIEENKKLKNMGENIGGKFGLYPGQWTDDTSMGLCLADSLLMNKGELNQRDLMHRFIAWWKGGYNNAFRFNKNPR